MGQQITLKNCRLAFPAIFQMKKVSDDPTEKAAYSAALLLSADDPQVDAVNEAIDAVAKEEFKDKAKTILAALRGTDKVCIHNGDLKAAYDGFEGNYFVSARSYTKVVVVDRDRTPLTEADGKPYAGCYVDANVEIWAMNNKWGKRINATLRWVQFRRDGDAFAGSPPANPDEIPDISVEEDEPLV